MSGTLQFVAPLSLNEFKGTVLIVSYYGFKNPIDFAVQKLADNQQWLVVDFPLFRWKFDQNEKTDRFLDKFISTIDRVNPDVVLFWYFGLTVNEMETLRHVTTKNRIENNRSFLPFVVYNWNDPYCWSQPDVDMKGLSVFFDGVITCCQESFDKYGENMLKETSFPGFHQELASKNIQKLSGPKRFVCDVVFCCTNLYECKSIYPDQRIHRRSLIDALANSEEIVFHLYGPERFKDLYPNCYKGYASYEETYELNRKARVCITTHVVSTETIKHYMNERFVVALASGGLVGTDIVPEGLEDCCFDLGNSVEEALKKIVEHVKKPYEETENMRQLAAKKASELWEWSFWAQRVNNILEKTLLQQGLEPTTDVKKKRSDNALSVLRILQSMGEKKSKALGNQNNKALIKDDFTTNEKPHDTMIFSENTLQAASLSESVFGPFSSDTKKSMTFNRSRILFEMFDQIFQATKNHDEEGFELQWLLLKEMSEKNETLQIPELLNVYWTQMDQFY